MKIDNYTELNALVTPQYFFEEGVSIVEEWWADSQNLFYHKFVEENIIDAVPMRKWFIIGLCKPKDIVITKENEEETGKLCKWLVVDSYTNFKNYEGKDDWDYYEWDFVNHCVKVD